MEISLFEFSFVSITVTLVKGGEKRMVEKIDVSRDEVLHYPWLDHTWVYVYFTENVATKNPIFASLLASFLNRGVSAAGGEGFEGLMVERGYVFIKSDSDKIVDVLKRACSWLLTRNWTVKKPEAPLGAFFIENKELFTAFWTEMLKMLEDKNYRYFFQRVDGMN